MVFVMEPDATRVVGMVEYVEGMLQEGVRFKDIAAALNFQDMRQLKRWMTKELGYRFTVYHQLSLQEVCDKIEELLPIHENGVNWGIRQVRAALTSHKYRIPERKVASALQVVSAYHYARRQRARRLVRVQYNVTIPMGLWHMDCKSICNNFISQLHYCDE